MGRKNYLVASILVITLLVIGAVIAEAGLRVDSPIEYSSNGNFIVGWHWLSSPGDFAKWSFKPLESHKSLYLNFSLLCTNKVNGGSGYSDRVKIEIHYPVGKVKTYSVGLLNPFKPQYPEHTRGAGYPVYGAVKIRIPIGVPFVVVLRWPGNRRYHIATRRGGLMAAYIEY